MAQLDIDEAPDAQDTAEVLDETHLTPDGEDIANFDEIADVYDVTQADGDADESDIEDDFDVLDDSELAELEDETEGGRDDEGLNVEREPLDTLPGREPS